MVVRPGAEDQLDVLRFFNTNLRITCVVFRSSLDLAGVSGSELIPFSV